MIASAQRPWDVAQQEGTLYPHVPWAEVKTFYCHSTLRDDTRPDTSSKRSRSQTKFTYYVSVCEAETQLYTMSTSEWQQQLSRTDNASTHSYNSSYLNRQQNKQDFPTGSAETDTAKCLGRYEKRTTFLSKQEEYSLIFRWWASFWCLVVRVSGDSHVAILSLALGFGPLVLFLLQTFGHLQVLLHQAALVDIGCQVALDWKRKGRETWFLDAHFEACLIQII